MSSPPPRTSKAFLLRAARHYVSVRGEAEYNRIAAGVQTEIRVPVHNVSPRRGRITEDGPLALVHVPSDRVTMVIVERFFTEPYGAASPESLRRMGLKSMKEFRARWFESNRRRLPVLKLAWVVQFRLWEQGDLEEQAAKLFQSLYPWAA